MKPETRVLLKMIAFGVATAIVLPSLISYRLRTWIMGRDRAFRGSSQLLSIIPGLFGQYLRRAFYARVLSYCHWTATFEFGVLLSQPDARIEENVTIGPRCHLGLVHLEKDVLLAAGVHVPSGPHSHGTADLKAPIRAQPSEPRMVRIGEGTWVASNAVVMADVGRHSIVGAGAVVTKPLPDLVIAAGVPARIIRRRDEVAEPQP